MRYSDRQIADMDKRVRAHKVSCGEISVNRARQACEEYAGEVTHPGMSFTTSSIPQPAIGK